MPAFALLLALLLPAAASAQVVISEVMYDVPSASGADDTREWIEIFNAGASSVDLTGWKINDGSNHNLNAPPQNGGVGSLTLASGAYAILADDAFTFLSLYASVSTVIDTSIDLNNTSDTLTLINADGAVSDTVAYTKEMGAAGDGNSVHRMSVASAALAAAAPSPGSGSLAADASGTGSSVSAASSTPAQATPTAAAPVSSYVPPPMPLLFADAGEDREVIVAADVEFEAGAYNRSREAVEAGVRFHWNFGDGTTAEGASVLHHYAYPGRYLVVLEIAENRSAASDRFIVTAAPAALALETLPDGGVAIGNLSGKDLDLSRWVIRSFAREFILPEGTVVLESEALRIPQKTLGFWSGPSAELAYPNGALALRPGEAAQEFVAAPSQSAAAAERLHADPSSSHASVPGFLRFEPEAQPPTAPTGEEDVEEKAEEGERAVAVPSQAAAAAPALSGGGMWFWLAAGIAAAGALAAALARSYSKKEWAIIEEEGESV